MRRVFADSYYWVALINDRDQGHRAARAISESLRDARLVTTDEVLTEVLAYFSERGRVVRETAVAFVEHILNAPEIQVLAQSRQTFLSALALYKARPDKGYSLTDCASMLAMRAEDLRRS